MPVNISGGDGSLEWHASLDTDDFIASGKKLEASLQQVAKEAIESNKKVQKSFDDTVAEYRKSAAANPFKAADVTKINETSTAVEELGAKTAKTGNSTALLQNASEALNQVQLSQVASTDGAAIAQEGLNTVMAASGGPVSLLLAAIPAVIAAWNYLSTALEVSAEKQKAMNDAAAEGEKLMAQLAEINNQTYKDATRQAENALSLAAAQGKSENEILSLRQKAVEAKKIENIALIANLGYNKESLIIAQTENKELIERIKSYNNLVEAGAELDKAQQSNLDHLIAKQKDLETSLNLALKAYDLIKAADAETANLRAEKAKKEHDDALKSSQAAADARLISARKNSKEELNARIADIKEAARVELDNVNLTSGERKKILAQEQESIADANRNFGILQLNNQKDLIEASLKDVEVGSAKELQLRIDLLNKNAQIERAADGVTAAKKAEIQATLYKGISDLTKKFTLENNETDVNTVIAGINKKLSAVEKGSDDELKLQKDLVDQKAALEIISAQKSINNAKNLANKITEIQTKEQVELKKLDDDYYDKQLQRQLKAIDLANKKSNASLQGIVSNPNSTSGEKNNASRQIFENDFLAVNEQMDAVEENIKNGKGDVQKLKDELVALEVKALGIVNSINTTTAKGLTESLKEVAKYTLLAGSSFAQLSDDIRPINAGLADALQTMSRLADAAGNTAKSISSFETKDYAGGISSAVSAISNIISEITAVAKSVKDAKQATADFQTKITQGEFETTQQYRERERAQQNINDLKIDGLKKEQALLDKQRKDNDADYQKLLARIQNEQYVSSVGTEKEGFNPLNGILGLFTRKTKATQELSSLAGKSYDDLEKLFNNGQLTDNAKALFEQLQKLKQEGVDIDAAITQARKDAAEVFTGTTVDSIVNSIADGFSQGFTSVEQFADKTQDIIRKAMLNALEYRALEAPIQKIYDQFAEDAESGGGLDTSEVANFTASINKTIQDAALFADQIQKATGINLSNANSASNGNNLQGGFKALTEQTGELLAGQFGGLRMTALDVLNVSRSSLLTLNKIENNTAAAAITLANYYRKWDSQGLLVTIR